MLICVLTCNSDFLTRCKGEVNHVSSSSAGIVPSIRKNEWTERKLTVGCVPSYARAQRPFEGECDIGNSRNRTCQSIVFTNPCRTNSQDCHYVEYSAVIIIVTILRSYITTTGSTQHNHLYSGIHHFNDVKKKLSSSTPPFS